MTVEVDGQCLYDGLPYGRYHVKVDRYDYLLAQSSWAVVTDDQQAELVIRLEPAALVRFDLTDAVREQITTDKVLVSCKVTDMTTQTLLRDINIWGEYDHHHIWMSLTESMDDLPSLLNLPEGTFSIDYIVQTMDMLNGAQVGPSKKVADGKTTVTCQLGQVATIVVAGQ
ncbi:hypothetical protein ES703_91661 [subsurface metagenome]